MTQTQFGLWSALAIHDTSSVVGATAKYGATALAVGTTVKLVRALWIVPLSLLTAAILKSKARIQWPWFILLFCLAGSSTTDAGFQSGFRECSPSWQNRSDHDTFLLRTELSRKPFKKVGVRPLLQGLSRWIVGSSTLAIILLNRIHI